MDGSGIIVGATGIRHVVEKGNTRWDAVLVNGVAWGHGVGIVGEEVDNLGIVGRAHCFGHGEGGVVDRSDRPLMESRLIGWRRCEGLIVRGKELLKR